MSFIPSQLPPEDIPIEKTPLFVTIGFDDNGHSGLVDPNKIEGITWADRFFSSLTNPQGNGNSSTFDGTAGSCTFYVTSRYFLNNEDEPNALVRKALHNAYKNGHEIGVHTQNHKEGGEFTKEQWIEEMTLCIDDLCKPFSEEDGDYGIGISRAELPGFRTPFLDYNNNTFLAVKELGFRYDCTIEEGFQEDQDGTNFFWPYRLDAGSPGNTFTSEQGETPLIDPVKDVWEVPSYALIAPDDENCRKYGIEKGFRAKLEKLQPEYFSAKDGKITGLDYNCLVEFEMNKAEFLATLKYSFDLRVQGNRAPFPFGAHSDVYATGYDICPNITIEERREAIEEFFNYVLTYDFVRVVSVNKMIDWLENPVALEK